MNDRRTADARRKRHEQAEDGLLRNQDEALSGAERAKFEAWRAASPENAEAYAAAERLMGDARIAIAEDLALRDAPAQGSGEGKPLAAGQLAAFAGGALFFAFDGPLRLEADMISGKEETPVFTLADGSSVRLTPRRPSPRLSRRTGGRSAC